MDRVLVCQDKIRKTFAGLIQGIYIVSYLALAEKQLVLDVVFFPGLRKQGVGDGRAEWILGYQYQINHFHEEKSGC